MHKRLLKLEEAAELLGVGRTKVYDLVVSGQLGSVRIGNRRLIPISKLDEYIETLLEEDPRPAA